MDPFVERHQLHLKPLPQAAEAVLRHYHAPGRLIAHLIVVHDVAAQLLAHVHAHDLADTINDPAVLFGAATHDIGKVLYPRELSEPGHQHEGAGKQLLLQAGIPLMFARFAETHGQHPQTAHLTIDDLLVIVADTCWKGKRDAALEQQITRASIAHGTRDEWTTFLCIDDIVEQITMDAEKRLAWQTAFGVYT